ncbi:MAG: hypothetical protein IPM77_09280 [Crocinitomicaceae bacterium]|nr:hypothetical protein [Crocinitomicaceae bacterium]
MKTILLCSFIGFSSIYCFGQVYSFNIIPTHVANGDYGIYLKGYGPDGATYQYDLVIDDNGHIFFENNSDYIFAFDEGLQEYFLKEEFKNQEITVSYKITDEPAPYEGADPNETFKTYKVTRIEVNHVKDPNNTLSPVETHFYEKELTLSNVEQIGDQVFRFIFENENFGKFISNNLPAELLALTDSDPSEKYAFNTAFLNKKYTLRYVITSVKESFSKNYSLEMVIFDFIK